ncbi:MAG: FAD-dependent oxidoreductase [Nocardiaceae bacterium]|nr:FAD-dependent oxidoreductase [Nocardiaceae bacterium]
MSTTHVADVCIVGAGIAGLNAAFVASKYLGKSGKIILVDRRERSGGMWVDTYDYVRLHQPHPMFTAGNIKWTLGKERSYLATKPEVLDHFQHCLDVIGQRTQLEQMFGWEYRSHQAANGTVRVSFTSPAGETEVIEAKRLIKTFGFSVPQIDPLAVSSTRVRSVSPNFCDVREGEIASSREPVWIVGSGKTAMDTAHTLITQNPAREVNLVSGSGTYFMNRELTAPTGAKRWFGGAPAKKLFRQLSLRFDGTNEHEVTAWYRGKYANVPTSVADHFMYGVLSEAENQAIKTGLSEVLVDHFVDAVDRNGGVDLILRSGASKSIPSGSWIVNCTGYVVRGDVKYEPYSSADGKVLSVQIRSGTVAFTSFSSYFLTHLMFLGKLATVPLYELDFVELHRRSQDAMPWVMASHLQYNLGLIADAVPPKVFMDCGLDFDTWYPLPRQLIGAARFMLTYKRDRPHNKKTLDTVHERLGIRCGPLVDA